ncbi:MAG: right-handed parallel beta-helix repeat-containing protein [Acidobacteriota bacterium]|nr:right-handed parallel beta-helix repeat-containing protein [Acidobacteriota bacterium]
MHRRTPLHTAVHPSHIPLLALAFSAAIALPASVHAAILCVDKSGAAGCYSTISSAIAASAPGDTVKVHPGTYHEDVTINAPVSLVGQGRNTTIIDATGLANGILVTGFDNPSLGFAGVDEVVISGFTVRNANFEGILVSNASHVTIFRNTILNNDQLASSSCAGLPAFEATETTDCGGGIHLIGIVHSSVTKNVVQGNAGGIVLSDETTTTHDDLVSDNLIRNNGATAGVTISSNPAYFAPDEPHQSGKTYAFGVYDVLVAHNLSSGNAAGVAILALGASSRTFANQITGNRLTGNTGPGVMIHTGPNTTLPGAKNPDASRNTIAGNYIADNGADPVYTAGATTSSAAPAGQLQVVGMDRVFFVATGPAGISVGGSSIIVDTLVTSNVIEREDIDVAFSNADRLDLHLNDLLGRKVGVANLNSSGAVNATENYWGCDKGPGTSDCSSIAGGAAVTYIPWLGRAVDSSEGRCMDSFFDVLEAEARGDDQDRTSHKDNDRSEDHGSSGGRD